MLAANTPIVRITIKNGHISLEVIGCAGPQCGDILEQLRRGMGLDKPDSEETKPEYAMASSVAATVATLRSD